MPAARAPVDDSACTSAQLAPEVVSRFFVLGGECNYLLACAAVGPEQSAGGSIKPRYSYGLVARETEWTERRPKGAGVSALLDVAEASIRRTMEELQLRGGVIRKSRAVGLIPGGREGKAAHPLGSGSTTMNREVLDEVVLRLHSELNEFAATQAADADGARLNSHGSPHARPKLHDTQHDLHTTGEPLPPFCAFNGGNDVWCDIGNKRVGVDGLRRMLELPHASVLHVGDQARARPAATREGQV